MTYLDCLYPEDPAPEGPVCVGDGTIERDDGSEYYWHCGQPGTITVEGRLMCEDHAGELGYGPKQEEYGYDPDDSPEAVSLLAAKDGDPQ